MVAPNSENVRPECGFTIVELVCAFAIVSVIALALVHTSHGKAASVRNAFRETVALRAAQAALESAAAAPASLQVAKASFDLGNAANALPEGAGTRVVRAVGPGLFEVEVVVAWLDSPQAPPRAVSLTTRIAQDQTEAGK